MLLALSNWKLFMNVELFRCALVRAVGAKFPQEVGYCYSKYYSRWALDFCLHSSWYNYALDISALLELRTEKSPCIGRLFSLNGQMPGGAGRRTSTSFEAINAPSAIGTPNLVR